MAASRPCWTATNTPNATLNTQPATGASRPWRNTSSPWRPCVRRRAARTCWAPDPACWMRPYALCAPVRPGGRSLVGPGALAWAEAVVGTVVGQPLVGGRDGALAGLAARECRTEVLTSVPVPGPLAGQGLHNAQASLARAQFVALV